MRIPSRGLLVHEDLLSLTSHNSPKRTQCSPPYNSQPTLAQGMALSTSRLLSLSAHFVRPVSTPTTRSVHRRMSSTPPPSPSPTPIIPGKDYDFPLSPVPKNPLGEGRYIKTAAALIIGCEQAAPKPPGLSLTVPFVGTRYSTERR
jgi:hypothetical protein